MAAIGETRQQKMALAIMGVLIPFAIGCGSTQFQTGGLDDPNIASAYMVNESGGGGSGFTDPATAIGAAEAEITADGTTANYKVGTDDIHDMTNVARNSAVTGAEVYSCSGSGCSGYIDTTRIADVDQDGANDDTFLIFTQNNPNKPEQTEYSYAYAGTRATEASVQDLRKNNHMATYTGVGTGRVRGAIGGDHLNMTGDVEIAVKFDNANGDIAGRIFNLSQNGPTPPVPVGEVLFGGAFANDSSVDYNIDMVDLTSGAGTDVMDTDEAVGRGSLFGPHAGGTIGVFAATGTVPSAVDPAEQRINLLGSFHGSTTDNDPVP